jgi:uncharacterized membrane protein
MPARKERLVFGAVIWVTRTFGWILIVIAVLGLPQLRSLTGRLAASFGLITSVALGLAGVAWLIAVQFFLRFFDRYLSRN